MAFTFELNEKGYLKKRESLDLEYKQNFQFGGSLMEYARSMVGMANNKGGEIIFGIQDSPRLPVGLSNDKFMNCDTAKVNQVLMNNFSHEVEWEMDTLTYDEKSFGRITIQESIQKPIVCKKTHDKILREAAIYYRYRGETKEIQYAELSDILQKEKDKEKMLWMKHIEKIGTVGPQNIHLLDTYKGELHTGTGKILLDKSLMNSLKFVKEGYFVDKEGAPTLRLVGEISGLVDAESMPKFEKVYPYLTEEVQEKLKINNHDFQLLIKKHEIKGNSKYHSEVKSGNTSVVHKYSEKLLSTFTALLARNPKILETLREEFRVESRKARASKPIKLKKGTPLLG
jgi:hypothetical protein